jgi:transposase-like protein
VASRPANAAAARPRSRSSRSRSRSAAPEWAAADSSASPDISGESLLAAIEESVEPGAIIYIDHYGGYNGLGAAGYIHYPTAISSSGDPAHVVMPRVHRIASLLKRWLFGTHQGAVRPQHLDDYLSEFSFRFNRRSSNHRGLLFYRLLEQAVQLDHVPLTAIVSSIPHQGALAG